MTTQTQALNIAIDYMNERLEDHDCKYQRHPATEAERINILADIETVKEALAQPEEEEKLHPVHIGVDVTKEGTAVTAFYRKPNAVMEMFYSQFHPLAQPEQEPVAIVHRNEYNEYRLEPHDNFDIKSIPFNIDVPLFKSPQRTWVGLTATEEQKLMCLSVRNAVLTTASILKEKNT